MATREEIYKRFEELDKRASLGEVDKIEKQHGQGKMTARERIEMLLDKGTFNELDKLVTHRCTDFGMEKKQIPGDGVVSGYGKVDGRIVFVYAYDFTAHGGSLSETNAAKIVKVQQLALKTVRLSLPSTTRAGHASKRAWAVWRATLPSFTRTLLPLESCRRFLPSSVLVPEERAIHLH